MTYLQNIFYNPELRKNLSDNFKTYILPALLTTGAVGAGTYLLGTGSDRIGESNTHKVNRRWRNTLLPTLAAGLASVGLITGKSLFDSNLDKGMNILENHPDILEGLKSFDENTRNKFEKQFMDLLNSDNNTISDRIAETAFNTVTNPSVIGGSIGTVAGAKWGDSLNKFIKSIYDPISYGKNRVKFDNNVVKTTRNVASYLGIPKNILNATTKLIDKAKAVKPSTKWALALGLLGAFVGKGAGDSFDKFYD